MSATRAAVIGSPVAHSLSPAIHNAIFEQNGRDCRYEAIETTAASVAQVLSMAKVESFIGLSVTMPLKECVIEYLDELTSDAATLNAVNCVKFENGAAIGHNTDGFGCAQAFRQHLGVESLAGTVVALMGAGGTARAIALELARDGAQLRVVNRTPARTDQLTNMVNAAIGTSMVSRGSDQDIADADLIVNATSVGMNLEPSGRVVGRDVPCDVSLLSSRHIVLDAVYQPLETAFLSAARESGARVIDGLWMLVWQAVKQQALWFDGASTDFSAMAAMMRNAAEQELARRRQ